MQRRTDIRLLLLSGLLGALATAHLSARADAPANEQGADSPADSQQTRPARIAEGQSTRQWLGAQANGEQASRKPQYLSGPAMSKIQESYIKSFGKSSKATDDFSIGKDK